MAFLKLLNLLVGASLLFNLSLRASCHPHDQGEALEDSEVIGSPLYLENELHAPNFNGHANTDNQMNVVTTCLSEINQQRTNNGKGQVQGHSQVEQAATNHNTHMLNNNCFSHQCSGEPALGERLSRTGYRWGGVGEIIAKGQRDCPSVVQAWMNSQGHKDIILGNYRHVGCSQLTCSNCADKGPWWTCVFASPL